MDMNSVIDCKPVKDASSPVLNLVESTYNNSFPEAERRAFALVKELVATNPFFEVLAVYKGDMYVGFVTAWKFEGFTYIEHFAIDEAARNGGIGAKVLMQFLSGCKSPVVLEVELPSEEMSKRRVGFYERLGFTLDDHVYFQPPYRKGEPSLEMRLMTYGGIDLNTSFEFVKNSIHKQVYGV